MADGRTWFFVLATLLGAMSVVSVLNARFFASGNLRVLGRWTRCLFSTVAIAVVLDYLFPGRPSGALLSGSFLLFFLVESVFYWIQLTVFNTSGIPLFADYRRVENAWINGRKYSALRRRIENLGFRECAAFKSETEGIETFVTCFNNGEKNVGLTVAFIPLGGGEYTAEFGYHSVLADDSRICTDSSSVPFGLEYPQKWDVERHPCIGDPSKLLKIHASRVKARGGETVPLPDIPDVNAEQKEVEAQCEKSALTNPPAFRDRGILTYEGKYKLWKDMILVNFLPFFVR